MGGGIAAVSGNEQPYEQHFQNAVEGPTSFVAAVAGDGEHLSLRTHRGSDGSGAVAVPDAAIASIPGSSLVDTGVFPDGHMPCFLIV